MSDLTGGDVLDIVALAEEKFSTANGQLTLLSGAIALVALHHGIRLKDLLVGVEATYKQTKRLAPNTAAAGVAKQPN